MNKGNGRVVKTALLMMIITLAAKLLGMLRDILLASAYGTGAEAVAYDTASKLPLLIFDFVIGGVITASFIPVFNRAMSEKGEAEALKFANQFANAILLITGAVTAVGVLLASPLVSLLAPSLDEYTSELSVALTRIMFPMVIFTGLAFFFVGLLQSYERFLLPSLISLVSNLIMVLYFVVFDEHFGIYGLAVAMLVGWGTQAIIQIPTAHKLGYRYRPTLDFSSPYIKSSLAMSLPILVSSWVQPFCNLVNTRFASDIENGSAIPAISYANKLYLIIVGVFTFVVTNLLFPRFSKISAGGSEDDSKKLTSMSIRLLLLVIIPITVGIFLLSEPLVSAVYERNEFGAEDVAMTATALRYFSLAMPFYAFNEICTKKFFSEQKTLPPMITAIVAIAVDILLAIFLSDAFGIAGIAVSSSLAVLVNALLNYILRLSRGDRMLSRADIVDCVRMLFSAVVMGGAVLALRDRFTGIIGLAALVVIGAAVYFLTCAAVHESILCEMLTKIIKRKKKE